DPAGPDQANRFFTTLDQALARNRARVLVHRENIDDTLGGLLGGYLVKSGLIKDTILATAVIQQILGRPLGPEGRALIPEPSPKWRTRATSPAEGSAPRTARARRRGSGFSPSSPM